MAHWRTMMDNQTMTAGDVRGDVTTTIESVKAGSLKVQGGKKKAPLIKLAGFPLPLGANPTNCGTIARMYGSDTDGWIGKRVTLYVAMVKAPDPEDKARSIMTEAIRVRPAIPTGGDTAVPPPTEPATGRDGDADEKLVIRICEAIDACETEEAIVKVIDPHRGELKLMGSKLIGVVAAAKTQRIANLKARGEDAS